jgi:hypothetical protein
LSDGSTRINTENVASRTEMWPTGSQVAQADAVSAADFNHPFITL